MSKKKKTNQPVKQKGLENPDFIIYTDGGCAFNPGGPGGCAAVIVDTSTGEVTEKSEGYLSTTNNRMELMAMIIAIRDLPDACSVEFYSDSQYLIRTLEGAFQKKKNQDLWKIIDRLRKGKTMSLNWVRGHSGIRENERCDQMCQASMCGMDLKEDEGYLEQKAAGREFFKNVDRMQNTGKSDATGREIRMPDMLNNEDLYFISIKDYCERYGVKNTCASGIRAFFMSRRNFRDYLLLKSGGIDGWSRKHKDAMLDILITNRGYTREKADLIWETICQNLDLESQRLSCLRWYLRGLPLYYCIRREYVNEEVSENCR